MLISYCLFFFFQAEDGIRDLTVTGSSDVCSSDLLAGRQACHRRLDADSDLSGQAGGEADGPAGLYVRKIEKERFSAEPGGQGGGGAGVGARGVDGLRLFAA